MNIVVCVKYVPDATADRQFESDNTVDREGVDGLLSELDEYAVEQALQLKEKAEDPDVGHGHRADGRSRGRVDAVRKALQMGADQGVHVADEAIAGSDAVATSLVLAKAVEKIGDVDLVVCGMASTDGAMSVVPAMLAERLDLPQVTLGVGDRVAGRPGPDQARRRHRHRGDRCDDAAGAVGDRPVRRGPLPVVQGDHGGEEEAAGDLLAGRPRRRRRARSASRSPGPRSRTPPPARRARPARSSPTRTAPAPRRSSSSSPSRSSSEKGC